MRAVPWDATLESPPLRPATVCAQGPQAHDECVVPKPHMTIVAQHREISVREALEQASRFIGFGFHELKVHVRRLNPQPVPNFST